jgi:hypothetical protein
MNRTQLGVFTLAAWMVAATAFGQAGAITEIKTPPMRDSDVITIPLRLHFPGDPTGGLPGPDELGGAGWAGARYKIHVQDPTEVDVDAVVAAPGYLVRSSGLPGTPLPPTIGPVIPEPFGPRSQNVGSVPIVFTVIHPLAQQSGINPPASHVEPLLNLVLHAKNTNLGKNSDIDITIMREDIWHTRDRTVPGSTFVHFPNSVRYWSFSNVNDDPSSWQQFHITDPQFASAYRFPPEGPPLEDPNGHWVHLPDLTFHNYPGFIPGSQFFAYMATTVLGIGIEHVPEPVSIGILGMGFACALMGVISRRRRCAQL